MPHGAKGEIDLVGYPEYTLAFVKSAGANRLAKSAVVRLQAAAFYPQT